MSLSAFIQDHHEAIIRDFAVFARTLMPEGATMSEADLRDHAEDLLTAIDLDLCSGQTGQEQVEKSEGRGTFRAMAASGGLHADDRIQHGFSLASVLAEFRALRASVLRLYELNGGSDLGNVRRFNEAVDEALTESATRFSARTDFFRDQFIAILSHDLRTPLAAITLVAGGLRVSEDNPQRRGRVAATILSSSERMERLIGDLLDLTRARLGGAFPLTTGRTDLREVCEGVIAEHRTAHPEAVLRSDMRGNLAGDWDADRLAQVVSNLVANAIQHGGGTPITVAAAEEGEMVTLTVHNTGAPIPVEAMPFIFEPLARGHDESAGMGHSIGLGLFIARAVVSAHGGDIRVTSSTVAGTTFRVLLPKIRSSGATG
jgi:signal transduction histidine kinase